MYLSICRNKIKNHHITLKYLQPEQTEVHHSYSILVNDSSSEYSHKCVAAMLSYDDYNESYNTVFTQDDDNNKALCWIFMSNNTLIVVKTSVCNINAAQKIINKHPRLADYVDMYLTVGVSNTKLKRQCSRYIDSRHRHKWRRVQEDDVTDVVVSPVQEAGEFGGFAEWNSSTVPGLCLSLILIALLSFEECYI